METWLFVDRGRFSVEPENGLGNDIQVYTRKEIDMPNLLVILFDVLTSAGFYSHSIVAFGLGERS